MKLLTTILTIALLLTPQVKANTDTTLCSGDSCNTQIKKLKRHARYGNPEALILLATAYLNGDGVEKNPELAFKKVKKATRSGSGKAMFMLSALYKDGIGTEQDIEKSNHWLEQAVAENYPAALYQKALSTFDFSKPDNSKELELLLEAESKNHKGATYLIARLRESGTLLEKDVVKAAKSYRNLAFWNYNDSRSRLENLAATIEADDKAYEQLSTLAEDIETITITGEKVSFEIALDRTINRITRNSIYDGQSTGSRISGRPCSKKTNCKLMSNTQEINILLNELGGQ